MSTELTEYLAQSNLKAFILLYGFPLFNLFQVVCDKPCIYKYAINVFFLKLCNFRGTFDLSYEVNVIRKISEMRYLCYISRDI